MLHSEPTVRARCFRAAALWLICFPGLALGQSTFTHVHLRVPDAWAAAHWYHTLVDGNLRVAGESGMGAVRQANGSISTMFDEPQGRSALPSAGSAIDHFGFTVDDVDATVEKARSMGATIDTEPRDGTTVARIAYIVDPWGTRMELLEDPDYPGMNHVHLMVNDADEVRDWFLEIFGGEFVPERGGDRYHGVRYENIWLHISEVAEEMAPSRTRSLDHFGFRIAEDLPVFAERIAATGYPPYLIRPNPPGSDLLWFEGPGGIHIEISSSANAPPR